METLWNQGSNRPLLWHLACSIGGVAPWAQSHAAPCPGAGLRAPRVLVADDHPEIIEALRLVLKSEGIEVDAVASPAAVLGRLQSSAYDALLLDLNYARNTTSGQEGLDLVAQVQLLDPTLPVIAMTGWGTVELAVEVMRRGVCDFIQKPWDNERLLDLVHRHIQAGRAGRLEDLRARGLQREYEEAREIQRGLLPKVLPRLDCHELVCSWRPASAVGGDYVDAVELPGGRISLCIADVVGKGLPAALLMSNLQAVFRAFSPAVQETSELVSKINRIISSNIADNKFITFFSCIYDPAAGTIRYCNAGHNPPILVRRDGSHARLEAGGPILGLSAGARYEQGAAGLRAGDRLVLFTDGLTETVGRDGSEFGDGRLLEVAVRNRACGAAALERALMTEAMRHGGGEFHDDVALLVLSAG